MVSLNVKTKNLLENSDIVDDYITDAYDMMGKVVVLVEGNNKFFYQNIVEFKNCTVDSSGSCSCIRKEVQAKLDQGNDRIIGIVDKDYSNGPRERNIFSIDFYSIENISIKFYQKMSGIHPFFDSLFQMHSIESLRKQKLCGHCVFNNEKKEYEPFCIKLDGECDQQFHDYINSEIVNEETFLKYKDLKKVVELYAKFYKGVNGKKNQLEYIYELSDSIPKSSLRYIMRENDYKVVTTYISAKK
ncbi:TPA: hypothetical protein QFV07_002594 [Enterococcus faecium]